MYLAISSTFLTYDTRRDYHRYGYENKGPCSWHEDGRQKKTLQFATAETEVLAA
jgi:hypothetical protein